MQGLVRLASLPMVDHLPRRLHCASLLRPKIEKAMKRRDVAELVIDHFLFATELNELWTMDW